MIRSMTGFSNLRTEEDGFSISVSVKSTNHRNLDLQLRLPSALEPFEILLRHMVKDHVARGHVELTVNLDRAGTTGTLVNRKLLEVYVSAFRELRSEFGSNSEPDILALLQIPGMIMTGKGELSPPELERIQQALDRVVADLCKRLNEMRAREGEALERDLR